MNSIPKWTGKKPDNMIEYNFKKDCPSHLRDRLIRVDFGLYGIAFIEKAADFNGVHCGEGKYAPIHMARLATGGYRIGLRDCASAQFQPWAEEWSMSMLAAA